MTETESRYDVLLLDFGGVCLLNPVELHHRAEAFLGVPRGTFTWLGPIDPDTDELWRRMVAGGNISERDYWEIRAAEVGAVAGQEMTTRQYMSMVYDPPDPELIRTEATATVERALAAGYGVSVLTNDMRAFHGREWEAGIDFLRLVDHIVDCSDTGILKPNRSAFQRAIDTVGADPERILFVDDLPLNVDGGRAAGLDGLWFDVANARRSWNDVAVALGLPATETPDRPAPNR